MIRTSDWKLVENGKYLGEDQASELYDLTADALELDNLAGRPEFSGVEADLRARLRRWREETTPRP